MPTGTLAMIVIAVFQGFQTILMAMGTFIIKDLRDRVARLEDIEMRKST
jgi:hypothetical protein